MLTYLKISPLRKSNNTNFQKNYFSAKIEAFRRLLVLFKWIFHAGVKSNFANLGWDSIFWNTDALRNAETFPPLFSASHPIKFSAKLKIVVSHLVVQVYEKKSLRQYFTASILMQLMTSQHCCTLLYVLPESHTTMFSCIPRYSYQCYKRFTCLYLQVCKNRPVFTFKYQVL